jgi:hypothetical protein
MAELRSIPDPEPRVLVSDALIAGAVAGVLSGAPSTIHAILRGGDPVEASLAAGTLLISEDAPRIQLLAAAGLAHAGLSVGWALVLAAFLPTQATFRWSVLAGLGIAALDLGIVGRRFPRIRALALLPQVADHLAFALSAAAVLARRRQQRASAAAGAAAAVRRSGFERRDGGVG